MKKSLSRRDFFSLTLAATSGVALASQQRMRNQAATDGFACTDRQNLLNQADSMQIYLPFVARNASSVVTHGSQLTADNTGVPAGRNLTDISTSLIVTEEWIANQNGGSRFLKDRHFLSGAHLVITVDGFTVQYCKFSGMSGISANANDGHSSLGKNISIQDCELDGNNENVGGAVAIGGASGLTLKRLHVQRWPRALWMGDNTLYVEECFLHDLTCDGGGAHIENIYVAGGANQTYLRNKMISNRAYVTTGTGQISASLAIYNESYAPFPDLDNILVQDNYFESDGGFAMYGGACISKLPKPYAKHMTVQGNIFGRGEQRFCGVYGTATAFNRDDTTNTWMNNTWGPRGPFWQSGDPEEGAVVAAPSPS